MKDPRMSTSTVRSGFTLAGTFVAATLVSSLFFARTLPRVEAADASKPVRGEPIKPIAPRGEPIKPVQPIQPSAASTPKTNDVSSTGGMTGDFMNVGFDKLASFKYDVPEDNGKPEAGKDPDDQIPKTVRDFSNKRVALKGFMLPLKVEGGLVTEMLIMRDQSMCCYGAVPKINEWVSVKMSSKGVKPVMDQPVTFFGKLKIGAIRENGYLVGIYAMDGEKIEGPAQ